MTRDEQRAVEHDCARLVARYANLNDAGAWDALASLFAPDGRMSRPSDPDSWIEGRDAILAAFEARPPRLSRHLCGNVEIHATSEREARGDTALVLFLPHGAPKVGGFSDRFVRLDGHWHFAERRGFMLF